LKSTRVAVVAGAAALTIAVLGTGSAQAAPAFRCEASALRGTVQGNSVEPSVAGRGSSSCQTSQSGLSVPLPPLISASLVSASTVFDPAGTASATGALADFGLVTTTNALAPSVAKGDLAIDKALATVPSLTLPGVPNFSSAIRDALRAQARAQAADTSLLSVRAVSATATASCQNGSPALSGSSAVAGVTLAGTELPVNKVVEQAIRVFGGGSVDPSQLDPAALGVPAELAGPARTLLDQIPTVEIPKALADVKITPGEQVRGGDTLTQRALRISAAIGGQSLLDVVLGEATVGVVGTCPGASVADEILRCTDRALVLVDVLEHRRRVLLIGAANRNYAGKRIAIRLRATGRVVARAKVLADGSFRTTAALPPDSIRYTNRARYQAQYKRERSLPLKLHRRMIVDRMTMANGKVTIAGRVIRPLASPVRKLTLKRRVSCKKLAVIKRFMPHRDGRFRVTVKAPAGQTAAVYRLQTRVRKFVTNPKTYPTFTLPRGVNLEKR
jgi:hypothetical protein